MELLIQLLDETHLLQQDELDLIEKLLRSAAQIEQLSGELEVSVTFVDNEQIQEINQQYRNIDEPTDVISFALEEQGEDEVTIVGIDMPRILGDIIISVPKAKQQAEEYRHSFQRELGFLAVHGFLHLLGYRHETEEEERTMFEKQKEILESHGLTR